MARSRTSEPTTTEAETNGNANAGPYSPRLKDYYEQELRPQLKNELGFRTVMEVPKLTKITLNMGVGEAKTDAKQLDQAIEELTTIAGQRAQVRKARKSVAQFKIREGMPIGAKVTLRGARMYEFLDRLISIALPRIRDFRGLNPSSFDGRGNYSMGVREQIIFPEINYDDIQQVRGLDVTLTTTAETDEQAHALLTALGMPFAGQDGRREE
jgi:large subunit ribosomal protein L5